MTQSPGYPGSPGYGSHRTAPTGYPPDESAGGHPRHDWRVAPAEVTRHSDAWATGEPDRYAGAGYQRPDQGGRHLDRQDHWDQPRRDRYPAPHQAPGWHRGYGEATLVADQPTTHLPAIDDLDRRPVPPKSPARKPQGSKFPLFGVISTVAVLLAGGFLLLNRGGGQDDAPADLAHPAAVVDRWLTAVFINKNPEETLRYTCKKEADRAKVDETIRSVRTAERDAKAARLTMKVAWSKPAEVSNDDAQATVKSTLTVTVGKRIQERAADFELVFEAGWRVCDTDMT